MLPMRPATDPLMLYFSGMLIFSLLRYGESARNSGITIPPCRMGCGAYGASVCGPGCGTLSGAGSGGNGACSCAAALPTVRADTSSAAHANPAIFPVITLTSLTNSSISQDYITGEFRAERRAGGCLHVFGNARAC